MFKDSANGHLIAVWSHEIKVPQVKEAFALMVGLASALRDYDCYPVQKGPVSDFRYYRKEGAAQDFAFIINQKWLLFYFRAPATRLEGYSLAMLKERFDSATENAGGEWTVRLRDIEDVRRLWSLLSLS